MSVIIRPDASSAPRTDSMSRSDLRKDVRIERVSMARPPPKIERYAVAPWSLVVEPTLAIRVRTNVLPPRRGSDRGDAHVSISGLPPGAKRFQPLRGFGIDRRDREERRQNEHGCDARSGPRLASGGRGCHALAEPEQTRCEARARRDVPRRGPHRCRSMKRRIAYVSSMTFHACRMPRPRALEGPNGPGTGGANHSPRRSESRGRTEPGDRKALSPTTSARRSPGPTLEEARATEGRGRKATYSVQNRSTSPPAGTTVKPLRSRSSPRMSVLKKTCMTLASSARKTDW